MSDSFLGEIKMFGANFAPVRWALCDGQLITIAQNQALFSLLGDFYGGDARITFGLPDLRGRLPVHYGQGNGLTAWQLGTKAGVESITLDATQIPNHNHNFQASNNAASTVNPSEAVLAESPAGEAYYLEGSPTSTVQLLSSQAVHNAGGSQPHTNIMPSLCINFIICMNGLYPPRS